MKKNKNTLLKIIIILFLSFIFGIWTGSVSANINTPFSVLSNIFVKSIVPQKVPFWISFLKNSAFFMAVLIFGFFPFGIPLIIFISFIDGVFYGYGFSYIISVYGFEKFKMFFIYGVPFNALKNISFFISSWFSAYRVIGKFNIKSGRRFLKQDRERSMTEFVIIFVLSTILSLLSCYAELLLYEKFLFLAIK